MLKRIPMLAKIQKKMRQCRARWKVQRGLHPSIRRYIEFCRRTWPSDYKTKRDSVVLVGLFHWNASVHCYAHVANHLARSTGSVIEWFHLLGRRNFLYEKIFVAFGARQGFVADELGIDYAAADRLAEEIFSGLNSKWDVINIRLSGVVVGDLIYDTYLRTGARVTVEIKDPALREIIRQAVRFSSAFEKYTARKRVVAVVADHTSHIYSGVIARLACLAGIPVFQVYYGPEFYVIRLEVDRSVSDIAMRLPWARYRELFQQIAPEKQAGARLQGRQALEDRLQGKVDGVLFTRSAYLSTEGQPVFKTGSSRPRVLILLHDFFDAIHTYRYMLFPDFYEWIQFLLSKAEETDFDWYVKPHPTILINDEIGRPEMTKASRTVLAELAAKFPKIHFLDPAISNRQIIDEGLAAMFTVHGTAGHEFAYLGVPVVNAGDSPHAAYSFNLHPKTVEEYEHCIRTADRLDVKIDRAEIEEYFFMNYFYFPQYSGAEGNPIPASYFKSEDYELAYNGNKPEAFDYFSQPLSPEETAKLQRYFDRTLIAPEVPTA